MAPTPVAAAVRDTAALWATVTELAPKMFPFTVTPLAVTGL